MSSQIVPHKTKVLQVRDLLERAKGQIMNALPRHITPDKMMRMAMTSIQTQPRLLDADPKSLIGAIIRASQLGLEIDVNGQAYLVPFQNRAENKLDVQLIPGYRGLVALARRSGEVAGFEARIVYKKDKFLYRLGTDPLIQHEPFFSDDPEADPGAVVAAYAVATFKDGFKQFEVMTIVQLESIRKRSKAKDNGPWVTDTEEMQRKTVARRLCKWLPVSTELAGALDLHDRSEAGVAQNLSDVVEFEVSDSRQSGEIALKPALDQAAEKLKAPEAPKDGEKLEPWQLAAIEKEKREAAAKK